MPLRYGARVCRRHARTYHTNALHMGGCAGGWHASVKHTGARHPQSSPRLWRASGGHTNSLSAEYRVGFWCPGCKHCRALRLHCCRVARRRCARSKGAGAMRRQNSVRRRHASQSHGRSNGNRIDASRAHSPVRPWERGWLPRCKRDHANRLNGRWVAKLRGGFSGSERQNPVGLRCAVWPTHCGWSTRSKCCHPRGEDHLVLRRCCFRRTR